MFEYCDGCTFNFLKKLSNSFPKAIVPLYIYL